MLRNAASVASAAVSESIESLQKVTSSRASPTAVTTTGFTPGGYRNETAFVVGDPGAVSVSADPQIAAGSTSGDVLKLIGTSDTNTVTFANGTGLLLNGSVVLRNNAQITLVWDGTTWLEVNRNDI